MNYSGLAETTHTFTVRSTDAAGNIGSDAVQLDGRPHAADRAGQPHARRPGLAKHPAVVHLQHVDRRARAARLPAVPRRHVYRPHGYHGSIADFTIAVDGSNDGNYSYTVRAVDAAGNESASSSSVAVTMDSGPPSVPANVHAAANPTRLGPVISWNASTGVPVAYEVLRNGSLIGTVNAPGTVFADASVTADGTYLHGARGRQGGQRVGRLGGRERRLRHDAPGAPGASGRRGPRAAARRRVSWSAAADAGSGVASYQVRRSAANGGGAGEPRRRAPRSAARSPATALGCADAGLTPGASYRYSVFAIDAVGNVSAAGQTGDDLDPEQRRQDAAEGADRAARGRRGTDRSR